VPARASDARLWNSYIFQRAGFSKTYARSAIQVACGATLAPAQSPLTWLKAPCGKALMDAAATTRQNRSIQMLDVLMIALTASFFALAIGYAYACERL
jgi:hypothetical protein